jgi:hypothetical protein
LDSDQVVQEVCLPGWSFEILGMIYEIIVEASVKKIILSPHDLYGVMSCVMS